MSYNQYYSPSNFSSPYQRNTSPGSPNSPLSPKSLNDLQIKLESTQRQLQESERQTKSIQQELQAIKRDYRDLQQQHLLYISSVSKGNDSNLNNSEAIQNLQEKLNEKDMIIANLKEESKSLPIESIVSEIISFVQYAQTTQKKFSVEQEINISNYNYSPRNSLKSKTESIPLISDERKEKLNQAIKKLQQISLNVSSATSSSSFPSPKKSNIKKSLSSFFDELHNFCDVFIESLLDKGISNSSLTIYNGNDYGNNGSNANYTTSISVSTNNDLKQIHDSEMEKLKMQNQLFRVQRRFDEENERCQNLTEQLKNEHLKISQFTGKLFQTSPIFDDEKFIDKELDLIFSQIKLRDSKIQDIMNQTATYNSILSDFFESNGIYDSSFKYNSKLNAISIDANENVDFNQIKRNLDTITEKNNQNQGILQNVMNTLLLTSNDPPQKILSEISKYMKYENDLIQLRNEHEISKNENDELNSKVESLQYQISELSDQNREASDTCNSLSQKVKQLRSRVSELEATNGRLTSDKSKLDMKTKELETQNQVLIRQKDVVETSLDHSNQELSQMTGESSKMKRTINDLVSKNKELTELVQMTNSQNSELNNKTAKLSDSFKNLSTEYQSLTESHNDALNDLKEKRQTIENLAQSLKNANTQIIDLKTKLADFQTENKRLQIYEIQSNSLSTENQEYLKEINEKDKELSALRTAKDDLKKKQEECTKLQESVDSMINAYQKEKEKSKILRKKAQDADFLREKTLQFEQKISKLSTDLATFQNLKKLVEQYESTIETLSTQSDNYQNQIDIISSDHAEAQNRIVNLTTEQSTLQRKYKDLKLIEKQEKAQLAQSRDDFSKATNENLKLASQVSSLRKENEELKQILNDLTNDNSNLKEIANKYDKLVNTSELMKEENKTLSEGLKTYEVQIKSLRKQVESSNSIISQLRGQFNQSESDRRNLSAELEVKNSALLNQKQVHQENQNLKNDREILDSKLNELQSNNLTLNSQIDTKNIIITNLNKQVNELKATNDRMSEQLSENREKMNQMKIANHSLKSEISTKSLIIQNYESKINRNLQLSANDSERFKTLQIENMRLKESQKVNDSLYSQIEEMRNQNNKLLANIAQLESKNKSLELLNATLTNQLDQKSRMFENSEKMIKEMKKTNKNLSNSLDETTLKFSELEYQSKDRINSISSNTAALENELEITKSRLRSIELENQSLKRQNQDLNGKNKSDNSRMNDQLSHLMQDNEILLRKIEKNSAKFEQLQSENRQLKNELRIKSISSSASPTKSSNESLLIRQKDETISQLRSLVQSQEASINEHENEIKKLSKFKDRYSNSEVFRLINSIERSLSEFPIDESSSENLFSLSQSYQSYGNYASESSDLIGKLKNIAYMIPKVKELLDEKERSNQSLSSMQSALQEAVLRMSGNRSPT